MLWRLTSAIIWGLLSCYPHMRNCHSGLISTCFRRGQYFVGKSLFSLSVLYKPSIKYPWKATFSIRPRLVEKQSFQGTQPCVPYFGLAEHFTPHTGHRGQPDRGHFLQPVIRSMLTVPKQRCTLRGHRPRLAPGHLDTHSVQAPVYGPEGMQKDVQQG